MDSLCKLRICCTIWTLIMLGSGVESVQIKSPCAVFHFVRQQYFQKWVGSIAEVSRIGLLGMGPYAHLNKRVKVSSKDQNVNRVTEKFSRQADERDNTIAFYATVSRGVNGLGTGQTIPFDKVLFDESKAFDMLFHAFECPVNGVYLFRSALITGSNLHIETELLKEDEPLFRMYSSGIKTAFHYDQGFNAGITKCEKGQRIWVRVNGNLGTTVRALHLTTFSGYLLWKTPMSMTEDNTGANSVNVAFDSYLSRGISNLRYMQTIPFDKVHLNEGQGYNRNNQYTFTCPINGLYMFQSSVLSDFGSIELEVVKDGDPFLRINAAASGHSSDQHDQGFNAGIIHCNKDQEVWVRVIKGEYVMAYQYTTFSGYLMWEEEEVPSSPQITGRALNIDHTHVAFHSYLSTWLEKLGKFQTIAFDNTSLNEGHGFDKGFHTFICPVDGTYVFQSASTVSVGEIETEIVKDGVPIARIYAGVNYHKSVQHIDQGFNSCIVNCNMNERVWVRAIDQSSSIVNYVNSTTFTGFLLKKL